MTYDWLNMEYKYSSMDSVIIHFFQGYELLPSLVENEKMEITNYSMRTVSKIIGCET